MGHHQEAAPKGIYLFSPSGVVPDAEALDRARAHLKSMGFRTTVDRTALAVHERFAGTRYKTKTAGRHGNSGRLWFKSNPSGNRLACRGR